MADTSQFQRYPSRLPPLITTQNKPVPLGAIARVVRFVAQEMRQAEKDVLGSTRLENVWIARRVVVWIARDKYGRTWGDIGRFLGGRHHTTVMDAYHRAIRDRGDDPKFRALTDDLMARAP